MIRRATHREWQLIRQVDHARVAGTLAAAVGGTYQRLSSEAITGITRHDDGWSLHDELPTLDTHREPTDVFHTPRAIDHVVWAASAERAAAIDPYAGLLVSIHSLRLSAGIFGSTTHPLPDLPPRERFELNRFQHGQIELQESLRRQLGLSTVTSLRLGLAEGSFEPREHQLTYDYTWLAALDLLSLAICCEKPPTEIVRPVLSYPNGAPGQLHLQRPTPNSLLIHPWPFEPPRVDVTVVYRSVPRDTFTDEASFHAAYGSAAEETFAVQVAPQPR